ncbi:uncharacterized protein LOC132901873 [Amyelois transitella]|uniref:uncharacterized protein LOC132901873 n=1 Tax=Amyelois transitella TaxID=680683 RepID=UPI00298FF0D4|nr:uncharacterized protein LOC132901873 [Amyelois transitella]
MHYLKTSIKGEAESILKHIQITSCNYLHAWNILKTRYGNKRLILNCTMKRLFNVKKINAPSAVQLKQLVDTTSECLNNLKNLDVNTSSWDPIIIYLLVQKLDSETHKSWEEHAYKDEAEDLPTWLEFKKFLESRFRTLELITNNNSTREVKSIKERSFHTATVEPATKRTCVRCKDTHTLCHCKDFIKMEPTERREFVKTNDLCFNCLVPGHSALKCRLPVSCRICRRRHHSLLHINKSEESSATPSTSQQPSVSTHVVEEEQVEVNTMIASHLSAKQHIALLATAVVQARSEHGYTVPLRALVDPGSEAAFISEKAAQLLKLERQSVKGSATGVGGTRVMFKHVVQLNISSRWDQNFRMPIQAYVMSKPLTTSIPSETIQPRNWPHIAGLNLADPDYYTPGSVDLLLGVKEYVHIIEEGLIKGPIGTPIAQKTSLGWILLGDNDKKSQRTTFLVTHQQVDVEDMLKVLWEIDTEKERKLTKEEQLCEEIYEKTTTRNEEGRYIVKLPFKTDNPKSPEGKTRDIAVQRLKYLERKFKRSPDLKREYTKVINEYIDKEYMEMIPEKERETKKSVYLPHHAVIRQDKESFRTRIVFDASCKGVNNISLNDELHVGPQLQEDLRNLLMRWRMKPVCFVADIQKMYFQVFVTKGDSDYQRVLWRTNDTDEFEEYRLLRVSFGTASAPYLAVKTLQRVANDEGNDKALAIRTIHEDFYMDDMLSGADTVEEAITLARDVTNILQRGGFVLTKWSSNDVQFMKSIDENKRSASAQVDLNLNGTIKTLGIIWNLRTDTFEYKFTLPENTKSITKRGILSDLQKLFDPLGWVAPSIVNAKILVQKLWLEKVNWDDEISKPLAEEWREIRSDFNNINQIKIERWFGTTSADKDTIQIHAFSDASMRAYGAAVYLRIVCNDGKVKTKLIAARTKVAPLKTISLPRLELCGALLLSRLMKQIGQAMRIPKSQMYAWTDAQIVLAWLCGEPNRWKPFVANRVVEILDNLNNEHWNHVQSHENPADLVSRGVLLLELKDCELWWSGPKWLSETEINIREKNIITTDIDMKTKQVNTYLNTEDLQEKKDSIILQFEQFDDLTELIKGITYCKRFLNYKKNFRDLQQNEITTLELEQSLNICIKLIQKEEYTDEISRLKLNKQVKKGSSIRTLNPYLDDNNILRVGGRLRHTNLPNDKKHPIILGNKNILTKFIVADAHKKTLHGGVELMLAYIRSKYWIIRVKSVVRKHIHKCLLCMKLRAKTKAQIMGDLPEQRVTPTRPFLHSGVDFAGPFTILMSKGRGNRTTKAYVAIFVCMSTKAIHIELVSDLSTEAFLGAFRRFVARRGKCSHIWSDQGRNFVGASKELIDAWNKTLIQSTREIASILLTEGTQWHFIPAYSPTFGGLWESGVKSIKYHLQRILITNLTYEEMTTILCQVEACLNSRPLCPVDSADPDNLDILTPGHFLIGESPIVVPSPDLKNVKIHTLSRWQHTQKLMNDFWRRWQDEYLNRLQQRPKWHKIEEEFKVGDIVLIKTDNLPPGKWSLGRIVDKHPGDDGYTRVYSIKSGNTITKITVTKLCALPIDSS